MSSLVAERLERLGYRLSVGPDTVELSAVMGRPPAGEIDRHIGRALTQSGNAG